MREVLVTFLKLHCMNIRKKILWTIIALTIGLSVIFSTATFLVLQKKFDQLERKTVVDSLERVEATFNDQILALDTLAHDWANWDDTYFFVIDHNKEYIASNIVDDTFSTSASIDVLLIFNSAGMLIHGVFYDNQKNRMELPGPILLKAFFTKGGLLDEPLIPGIGKKGIVQFGNRHLIVAARSILRSNGDGPSHGTLIMGRILNKKRIDKLQKITRTSVELYPLGQTIVPPEVMNASAKLLESGDAHYISAYSEEFIKGFRLLHDVTGNAALLLALNIKRDIHHQSHKTINFLLLSLIIIGIIFGLAVFFLIDTLVLERLSALTRDIVQIEQNTPGMARVKEFSTGDELGKLSSSLNRMLGAIESLEKYKLKNEKLEVLATFAAGAAHEFATPLSTIAIASGEILHDLQRNGTDSGELYDDIILIRKQVNRCKDILFQMAADAGEHMGEEVESISIRDLISGTLVQLDPFTIVQTEIHSIILDKIVSLPVRSLRRVLRGIIKNSIRASGSGTPVILSCYENASHLFFKIQDQGTGMDKYTLKHAADPFFTTRSPGDGMGLGLYLAQSLASRFEGQLRLFSEPGTGTTVILSLARGKIHG